MTDAEIVEYALRAAELADQCGIAPIARQMLALAAGTLTRYVPLPPTSLEVMVTTDFQRGCPCS